MLKKIVFSLMYLNLMKSLANGFVIDGNNMINQWLQPFNISQGGEEIAEISLTTNEQSELNHKIDSEARSETSLTWNEQSELNPKINSEERSVVNEETPLPIRYVLETLQTEINEADNQGKKYYEQLLTDIEQMFAKKSRYTRVFFNHMWRIVDLGLYGSSQRTRDASTLNGMLKPLRDLIKWLYKNFIDLITWNIATDDEDDDYKPPVHKEESINVTTKAGENGEDNHKITHKFEVEPFSVKLDMDITCRILDDSKKPNHPEPSSSHPEGEQKKSEGKEKEEEDDWDYSAPRKTRKPDQKDVSSGSQKDSKRGPESSDKEAGSGSAAKDKPSADGSPSNGSNSSSTQGGEKKPKKSLKNWITGLKPPSQ